MTIPLDEKSELFLFFENKTAETPETAKNDTEAVDNALIAGEDTDVIYKTARTLLAAEMEAADEDATADAVETTFEPFGGMVVPTKHPGINTKHLITL